MIDGYIKKMRNKIGHDAMFMPTAGAIIYKNGKVLIQKRADDGNWAMHGGGLNPNEEFLEALTRELKEEMNIEPVNPKLCGIYTGRNMFHEYPNGDKVYVWRLKGMFAKPDKSHKSKDNGTDANGQTLVYTNVITTHKFAKNDNQGAKALNVDTGKDLANVSILSQMASIPARFIIYFNKSPFI